MEGAPDWVEVNDFEAFKNTFKNHQEFIKHYNQSSTTNHQADVKTNIKEVYYEIAGAGKRFTGLILYLILTFIISNLLHSIFKPLNINFTEWLIITAVLINFISYKLFSGNIGHVILSMKVVKADTMEDFNNPIFGLAREFIKSILLTMFFIIHALIIFDKRNQNVYDKFLNTIVVNKKFQYNSSFKVGSL
jgi:uncharacterized RDD family membrane protein YckC